MTDRYRHLIDGQRAEAGEALGAFLSEIDWRPDWRAVRVGRMVERLAPRFTRESRWVDPSRAHHAIHWKPAPATGFHFLTRLLVVRGGPLESGRIGCRLAHIHGLRAALSRRAADATG
jgi:hypothetical protein